MSKRQGDNDRVGPSRRAIALLLLLFPTTAAAGRIPEDWDYLPQLSSFSFSESSVGMDRRFVFDRATEKLEEVTAEAFAQRFAGSVGVDTAEVTKETGTESTVLLKTSVGRELTTQNAYCAEGMGAEHSLSMDSAPVKDHVSPCISVSSAEIVGKQLWLGTRYDGEYGDYPGEGIVVQSLDTGELVRHLSTNDGLTGNLIRAIRFDPFGKSVWVATNEGINELSPDFRVRRKLYFNDQLDPETGTPVLRLGHRKLEHDPLVPYFRGLRVVNAKGFYDAFFSIPASVREQFLEELAEDRLGMVNPARAAFLPTEMNVLLPFFLEGLRSDNDDERTTAEYHVCRFHDERVLDLLSAERKEPTSAADFARGCRNKYVKYGLVEDVDKPQRIDSLLAQEKDAFERMRGSRDHSAFRPEFDVIADSARRLKQEGDLRGMELINEYFRTADLGWKDYSSPEVPFYNYVALRLNAEDEIAPSVLEGLRRMKPYSVTEGCGYFDVRWPNYARRFDASYAEALLLATERQRPRHLTMPAGTVDYCAEAFKSQLTSAAVREAFFEEIVPQLTASQQVLARELSKEPPAPLQ